MNLELKLKVSHEANLKLKLKLKLEVKFELKLELKLKVKLEEAVFWREWPQLAVLGTNGEYQNTNKHM